MADVETKVEETVEVAEEAKATETKATKEKKSVDLNKIMDSAKKGVGVANNKITAFFTGNGKRSKLVLTALMLVEALLAFSAGFINFLICVVLTIVGFVGLNAAIPTDAEEKAEDSAE